MWGVWQGGRHLQDPMQCVPAPFWASVFSLKWGSYLGRRATLFLWAATGEQGRLEPASHSSYTCACLLQGGSG